MTLFFPLSWKFPNGDLVVLQESWQMGADVGVVLTPFHSKEAIQLSMCSGLPIMVDNGAYTAWKKDVDLDWTRVVSLAEDVEARFVVTMDIIGKPEESLQLSLEAFKSTDVEKIVPFHAVTLGAANSKMIKRHLRLLLDNGVRVFGIPCPAANRNGQLRFALKCRWIIPRRCHALGFPFGNRKYRKQLRYFETADATFFQMARSTLDRRTLWREICRLYQGIRTEDNQSLMNFIQVDNDESVLE